MKDLGIKESLKRTFGSLTNVAEILGISPSAISVWVKVPEKHHKKLIAEAEKIGYKLTIKQLRGHK